MVGWWAAQKIPVIRGDCSCFVHIDHSLGWAQTDPKKILGEKNISSTTARTSFIHTHTNQMDLVLHLYRLRQLIRTTIVRTQAWFLCCCPGLGQFPENPMLLYSLILRIFRILSFFRRDNAQHRRPVQETDKGSLQLHQLEMEGQLCTRAECLVSQANKTLNNQRKISNNWQILSIEW